MAAVQHSGGSVKIVEPPQTLALLRSRPGLTTWKVSDMHDSDTLFSRIDEVPEGRSTKAKEKSEFSRRGLLSTMFGPQTEAEAKEIGLDKTLRIFPQDADTGGFFVCLLQRVAPAPEAQATQSDEVKDEESAATEVKSELPQEYIDKCTRLSRTEAKISALEPYVPLLSTDKGQAIWDTISSFYGIKAEFQHSQLLAHSDRIKAITFVTAPARKALDATKPAQAKREDAEEGPSDGSHALAVVVAGVKMFEENKSGLVNDCQYRLCMDGLPYVLPYLTKRVVTVEKELMRTLLAEQKKDLASCPQEIQDLEPGSMAAGYKDYHVVLWRGRSGVQLWVAKEEAESMLSRLNAETA